jgi:hypothetical protein
MLWKPADRPDITVSLTDRALTIARSDTLVVAWDRGGRLYSVWDAGRTCRRGLNGCVLVKWRERGARLRAWASEDDAAALVDRAAAVAREVSTAQAGLKPCSATEASASAPVGQGFPPSRGSLRRVRATARPRRSSVGSPGTEAGSLAADPAPVGQGFSLAADPAPVGQGFGLAGLARVLGRAAAFDATAAAADAAAFRAIYRPIGILPPDHYLSLVLQATEGCSFRCCTFCDFHTEPYRVKSAAQFTAHVPAVVDYLGESMSLRNRAVFLGSANALAVPTSGLLPIFDVLAGEWPGRPVHAFLDGFTGTLKGADEYRALGERRLQRVYLGLESGCDALLAFVHKPAMSAQAIGTVRAARAGGVGVGLIVMLGLGGGRFAESHVADMAHAINAMELGAGDLLYFSELVESPGSPYAGMTRAADVRALDRDELTAQRAAIEHRLVFPGAHPRLAAYDVREFVY